MSHPKRAASARYKSKKKVPGSDTIVYEYSPRQIALRNNQKAERLEKLSKSIGKLRAQVKKDLSSGDPDKSLTALAIALIDHTYERVGNSQSAEEGHVGVTGWQRNQIFFGNGKATIKYVGKSGVDQKKTVTDKTILKALKDAYEAAEDNIFEYDTGKVDASTVNAYLKRFGITAKDIRGLHANREMREHLKAGRKGELPEDPKERAAKLKDEWKKALDETAKAVGHKSSTLSSQYLVPGLEDMFLKDGTVMEKMKASSMALRVATLYSFLRR